MVAPEELETLLRSSEEPRSVNLTSLLLPYLSGGIIVELEAFRYRYEREHGPTNLKEVFISQYPIDYQLKFFELDPVLYWNRHPAYARAFWLEQAKAAMKEGQLDEVPAYVIQAYSRRLKGDQRFRG